RRLAAAQWRAAAREAGFASAAERLPVLRPSPRRRRFEVLRGPDGVARVEGRTPEWLAATLDLGDEEARGELFRRLQVMGIARALERIGVERGDRVRIGLVEVAWEG
ncbi:MAG: Obg family GTPase CgtA, partial [Chloroflexi bacterium]|nr:Obg family GTPase CgtA [Chloroflexota bacterium]